MMKPRRLSNREKSDSSTLVTVGDDESKGFRPYTGPVGFPAGEYHYPLYKRRAILVIGHGGHGKGEVCKLLTELYGAECMSSSRAAAPHIFPALNAMVAAAEEPLFVSPAEAYEYRRRSDAVRLIWKELISLYNTPDKTTLSREILAQADVYDGMRCAEEFAASRHLFDYVVWVDAAARVGTVDPTLTISRDVADLVIDNNGTLDDLRGAAVRLGARLGVA